MCSVIPLIRERRLAFNHYSKGRKTFGSIQKDGYVFLAWVRGNDWLAGFYATFAEVGPGGDAAGGAGHYAIVISRVEEYIIGWSITCALTCHAINGCAADCTVFAIVIPSIGEWPRAGN